MHYLFFLIYLFVIGCGGNSTPTHLSDNGNLPYTEPLGNGNLPDTSPSQDPQPNQPLEEGNLPVTNPSQDPLPNQPLGEENLTYELPVIHRTQGQTDVEYFLEQFFKFCETNTQDLSYPFCLTFDFRKIRSILSPKIQQWKNLSSTQFIDAFNQWAESQGHLSHLMLCRQENLPYIEPINLNLQINQNIKYLKIESFMDNIYFSQLVQKTIDEAHKTGKLIIDLRDNPGGYNSTVGHLLSFFLPEGTIYGHELTREHLNYLSPTDYQYDWNSNYIQRIVQKINKYWKNWITPVNNIPIFNGKIAILVNKNTACAAEIFTYALKIFKQNRVRVFGTPTAGKEQGSIIINASVLKAKLHYPVSEDFTIDGKTLEGIGVRVDEEIHDENHSFQQAQYWLQNS